MLLAGLRLSVSDFYGIGAVAVIVVLLVIADWVREELSGSDKN